jgi:mono/diheme cytochrome c family protein
MRLHVDKSSRVNRGHVKSLRASLSRCVIVFGAWTHVRRKITKDTKEHIGSRIAGRTMRWLSPILVCVVSIGSAQAPAPAPVSTDSGPSSLQPFFSTNCFACHNSQAKVGGMDLQTYSTTKSFLDDRTTGEKILKKLQAGEMPPPGMPRPSDADLKAVINKIQGAFETADTAAAPDPGHIGPHRLNRAEYDNTVRDLLGVDIHAAQDFPQDDSAFGFDNMAETLSITPVLLQKYLAAAEKIANIAVYGPDLKPEPVRFDIPIPRRMETTNVVKITKPAYYSMQNYDTTGLSMPGSYHLTYKIPVTGEYDFKITGAGNRPPGSEPTQCDFWIDGKLVKSFDVANVSLSGFERRPDAWELRLKLPAGDHEIVIAFPKEFDGLPPRYGGPNPSTLPEPPPRNFLAAATEGIGNVAPATDGKVETRAGKIAERELAIQRAKEQALHPTWEGLSVNELDIVGPYDYTKGASPESHQKIFVCEEHTPQCMRRIISNVAMRAYRRPVAARELTPLLAIAENAERRSGSFNRGVEVGLEAILVSPDFLFRVEKPVTPGSGAQHISDYALASRLSYFLWSTMPDAELMKQAAAGCLSKPEVLKAEVKRMLADPKSKALYDNFASEWLETRALESVVPDRDTFPDFDEYLRASMQKETELFFMNIVQNDGSILDMIDGKYSFLNERLAAHYGIPGVKGTEFRKVDLSDTPRAGVLGQGGILTVSSYATRTSVVIRGKWVLENIYNDPPPPPPPNVPALKADEVGTSASLRKVMEAHRANPVCASCHTKMDPLGFGLENFDAVGRWRDKDGNFAIDSSGQLPDGRTFQGPSGLESTILADKDKFAMAMTTKLMEYALGRGLESYDRPVLRKITSSLPADDYRFSSIVLGIVNSYPFQNQKGVQVQ